ncbi:unnamed protein product [Penicillium manginii]
MPHFREGQRVNYKPVGGPNSNTNKSIGVIHNVCTSKSSLTGRIVEASEAEPCYEVRLTRKPMLGSDSQCSWIQFSWLGAGREREHAQEIRR